MRVPISWLREYVALPPDAEAIADRLAMLGFPVEEIAKRPAITGVVAGRIVELEKHPNADRLQVAQVDVGGERPLTIATAATNVAAGQTIAVATIGARLPGLTIAPRTMRGVASEGMMISAEELALEPEWFEDGILQLEPDIVPGTNVVDAFGLNDAVLDVEITSNRPDAMSLLGLARELAASYGVPFALPSLVNPGEAREPEGSRPEVVLESPDCRHFVAQRFDALRVAPAPAWMRVRLALAGQRPINNLVDVSNYVMLETGQPLHFYDAAEIHGGRLVVRDAREGERIVTLDGVERTLSPLALVIADADRPLCLAGLMGSTASEVNAQTTAIVLEAANFTGARVRRASNALALRSEASSRHEKSLAPALAEIGAARAAQLLAAMGGTAYLPHVFGAAIATAAPIPLAVLEVERLLGTPIPAARVEHHLAALGCTVTPLSDGAFSVTPPPWRRDLALPADLIEEVARVEGYERIPSVVPPVPAHGVSSAAFDLESRAAHALAALGYREAVTLALHGAHVFERLRRAGLQPSDAPLEVRNPLSEEQRYLRDSLLPGLLAYLAHAGEPSRVFEAGHVFFSDAGAVAERALVAFAFSAEPLDEPAWRDTHFLRLKGDAEALLRALTGRKPEASPGTQSGLHPGKTAVLSIDERVVGTIGAVDPRLCKAYDLALRAYVCALELEALPAHASPIYRAPSKYPSTYRDVALVLDASVRARDVERAVSRVLGPACTGVAVFDEYRGPQVGDGRKSLAVRMTLQRFDATITDEEADAAVARVLDAVREEFGATIRT